MLFAAVAVAVIYREPIIEKYHEMMGNDTAELAARGKGKGKEHRDPRMRTKHKAEAKINDINDMNQKKLDILEEMRSEDNK